MRFTAAVALLVCAGCSSAGVPADVLDVARATRPGGAFHVEYAGDGRLIEAAGEVPLDSVPAACRAAADAKFPGARGTGAERAWIDGTKAWVVAMQQDGRSIEVIVREDGTDYGGEEVLAQTAWPAAVVEAAKAAVPGAALERVERVWGPEARGREAYHVKFEQAGESVRVGVAEDATIVRVVRRMAGQIRVAR